MSKIEYKDVKVERRGGVGWVTFNRPDRYNACDFSMFQEVGWGIREMSEDPAIGVIVLTGAGDKSFCAGGFLKDLQNFSTNEGRKLFNLSQETFNIMRHAPQPVIAAVNGVAVGGGNEFVVCSDLAIASDRARFGQAGTRVGSSPVFGANNLMSLQIGEKKAKELCFLSRLYSAQEALEMGLGGRTARQEPGLPRTHQDHLQRVVGHAATGDGTCQADAVAPCRRCGNDRGLVGLHAEAQAGLPAVPQVAIGGRRADL